MKTYGREAWVHSQNQWRDGEFGPVWEFYRQAAADRGFIYPPVGSKWDSWEDDQPSQRAILYRAIEETPQLLIDSIRKSRSWGEVIGNLIRGRDDMREDAELRDREVAWNRQTEPGPRESMVALADILGRIRDSAA